MPLNRYQIRNEYGLADPELYRPADKDDPEALLEGVAMAGLVGVLRQLGDLAEFAAEIFHELHEEVMATAARGHGLMVRVQQLEAEFPSIEKAFLSQTSHSAFFYNTGTGSHPNLRMNQNLITQRDIPRFVMDSYEECRGPPRLFLLDKFDVAGAGACLKRYTDPSFFKALSSEITNTEVQREKKIRKVKKNGSRWRNGETPDVLPPSHAKLHQLFLEERVENGIIDPARRVQLKRRLNGFPFESRTGESYMEKLFKACSPDNEVVHKISNVTGESGLKILGISSVSAEKELPLRNRSPYASNYIEETSLRTSVDELNEEVINGISEMPKQVPDFEAQNSLTTLNEVVYEKEIEVDGGNRSEGIVNGYQSDDIASETDNYMDALTTMDSEMETDEYRANHELAILNIEEPGTDHAHFSDSQSVGNSASSDNGNSSAKQGISSFSYSDSSSMEAESIPSDGDVSGKVFPSTEIYEAEIADMSPDQRSDKDEVPAINTPAHVVSDGAYKSEFGVPSPRSCLTDTAPVLSPSNQGTSLKENSILGPYLNEISADSNEVVTNVNIEENGASVKENSLVEPERDEISSDCKEVVTYTNIEENGTHLEGNTLLGPELDGISSDCNEFVSYANKEENETQLGDSVPSSSDLLEVSFRTRDDSVSTLSAETDPKDELDDEDPNVFYNSALHFSNILDPNPDNECSENLLDDVWQTDTENVVDSQTDSPYSVILRSQEHPVNSVSNELIISDADIKPDSIAYVGDNAIASARDIALNTSLAECSPQSSNCTEQELSEIVGAALPLEINSAQTCTSYSGDKNLDSVPIEIPFHSRNSPDSALDTYVQSDLVVRETVQSQVLAVACSGSVTDNDDKIDSSSLNVTKLQEESLSTDEDSCENQLEISKTCLPDYLEKSDTENQVDHQGVASPDLDSVMSNTVSYDHPESDLLKDDSGSSMAEDADKSLCLGYASTLPLSSDESDKDSEPKPPPQSDLVKNSEDFTPSPDHHLGDPRVPSEQKVELKAGLDVESRQAGKESSDSSFQLDQIQTPLHLDQQRSCDASAISTSSPSIVTNHKLDVPEQAMGSFSSFFPAINLDHEPIQINLEEMPPLPPLPPMQWRLGKIQKISLPSESGSLQQNLGHFPPTFPKAQVGEISQLPNAFSPLSGVRDDRRAYENFGGNLVHSSPFPLQGPNLVDRGNSQQDFFTSGRAQPTNPFLALPTIFNECPGHGVLALEGGTQHPSSKPLSTIKVVEDIASANPPRPSQETSLENEKLRNSAISEEKVVDPPDTTLPPPRMEDEQLSTPLPVSEDEKPNDNQQMKLPRPRSPLVDAVATHDKSKLRKVTERVRPQIGQKVEEKDSLLEQIRTKSFNLKPSVVTRPIIQGPKTNLRVAAILEKAKTIRQAFAGSDEDDDPDSWSDS